MSKSKFPKVVATIIKITNRGERLFGHQKGEKFVFTEMGFDRPMCIYAQQALTPAVEILLHGGWFPWAKKKRGKRIVRWGCFHPGRSL